MKNLNNAHSLSNANDVNTYVRWTNGLNDWQKLNPLSAKTQAQYAGRVRSGLGLKRDKVDNGYSEWDYGRVFPQTKSTTCHNTLGGTLLGYKTKQ